MKSLKHLISKRSLASILAAAVMFSSLPVFSVPVWADTTIKNEDGSTTTVTTDANGNHVETTTNSEGQVVSRRTTYNDNPSNYIPAGTSSTSSTAPESATRQGFTQTGTHDIYMSGNSMNTVQDNKVATSDIRARTEGYRFTNETTGQTMVVSLDDSRITQIPSYYTDSSTGYLMTRIISSFSAALTNQIFNTIGNPLAGGQLVRMDHIMSVTTDGGQTYSGQLDANGTFQYNQEFLSNSPYAARVMKMSADGLFDKNELTALQKVFGWAHPESWETNYEKYLYLKDGVLMQLTLDELLDLIEKDRRDEDAENKPGPEPPAERYADDLVHTASCLNPTLETYDDSRNYTGDDGKWHAGYADVNHEHDAGIIIPSKELLLNGLHVNTYAGYMELGFRTTSHTFSYSEFRYDLYRARFTYDHWWEQDGEDEFWNAEEQRMDTTPHYKPMEGWREHAINTLSNLKTTGYCSRNAFYMYIKDLDLYDFGDATATNGAYGSASYNGTMAHLNSGTPLGPNLDGPVNSIGGTRSDRPSYAASLCTGPSCNGNSDNKNFQQCSFTPDDGAYIQWAGWTKTPIVHLGTFSVYSWGEGSEPPRESGEAQSVACQWVEDKIQDGKKESSTEWVNMKYYAQVKTDSLTIGYGSKTVMEGYTRDVHFEGNESYTINYGPTAGGHNGEYPSYVGVGQAISNMDAYLGSCDEEETYETTPAFGREQMEIPASTKNGIYTTSVSGSYTHVSLGSGKHSAGPSNGYMAAYSHNNPIKVETPVVAPVSLYDDPDSSVAAANPKEAGLSPIEANDPNHKTQLAHANINGDLMQLRLDNTYWLKFNPHQHLQTQGYKYWNPETDGYSNPNGDGTFDNAWSDDDIKWDKYVHAKYIHLPFAACVYLSDSPYPTYYPATNNESDPNYWIKIYDEDDDSTHSNLVWTKFYIPSWAQEGQYPSSGNSIRVKVEAVNVMGNEDDSYDTLNHSHGLLEFDDEYYVAEYKIGSQLSGWIYDFQIVGINNRDLHDQDLSAAIEDQWHDLLYPFAYNYEEKKAGTKNRLGGDPNAVSIANYVRYTRSGEIAKSGDSVSHGVLSRGSGEAQWSTKNTIIIDKTKSNKYSDAGTPPTGTEFAFSVRTMSNLWNDGDYVTIRPSFWWMSDDGVTKIKQDPNTDSGTESTRPAGTEHGDYIHVYYHDYTQNGDNLYVEYDSDLDHSLVKSVSLIDTMFNGSYFDEDVTATVAHPVYDAGTQSFSDQYSSDLQTRVDHFLNQQTNSYTLSNITLNSDLRLFTGHPDQFKVNLNKDRSDSAMPNFNYNAGGEESATTSVRPSIQTWYGCYVVPSNLFVTTMSKEQVSEYALTNGGIAEDDPNVWDCQDGYLIVHFDIESHNSLDPTKNLLYDGGYSGGGIGPDAQNMWQDQSYPGQLEAKVGSSVSDSSSGHYGNRNITVDYGDVIVINTEESIDDWFSANIFSAH